MGKKRKKAKFGTKKQGHVDLMNVALKSTNQSKGMMILPDDDESSSSSMNFGDNSLNSLSHSIMSNAHFCSEEEEEDKQRLNQVPRCEHVSHNTDITPTSDSNHVVVNAN